MPSTPQLYQRHGALLTSTESTGTGVGARQNVKWVEGVRGVASFAVVLTHICRAWDYTLFFPKDDENAVPRLLQLPFLRLPWQGRIGLTMFSFLTGYVCAIKPLRQAKSGNKSGALTTLAQSAFRRPPRLILPSTIALIIAWFCAQLGGFTVALRSDSPWLRDSSPRDIGPLHWEIPHFFRQLQRNWVENHNDYDDHQWALKPLLLGAFLVYLTLSATTYMKSHYRTLIIFAVWLWYWCDYTPFSETFTSQFLFGLLLCDIGSEPWYHELATQWGKARRVIQTILIITGAYVACYPVERPEWAEWSRQLIWVGERIFPPNADLPRRWTALGWNMMAIGIWLSPTLQGILSNKLFMWLGRNSFAVYLTHGTLLRVFAARLIYGWSGKPLVVDKHGNDEHYLPRGGTLAFVIGIPVFLVVEYTVAHFWTTYVDSFCARVTKRLEDTMFEDKDEKNGMLYA